MAQGWQAKLDQFAAQVGAALGENLRTLLLFGSAARRTSQAGQAGQGRQGRADMNLLLIVGDASAAALRPVAPAIAAWVKTGQPAPLIFSESEWRASADVFPIEIEDMREAHRLLGGRDPFESVQTERSDLRQELEREIRSKLLRLRTEYAAAAPSGKALGSLLENSAGTFFVLFRAVVRVVGKVPPAEPAALVGAAAAAAGMDPAAFDWVLGKLAGRKVPALAPYDAAGGRYVDAIERLARFVDQTGLRGEGTNG